MKKHYPPVLILKKPKHPAHSAYAARTYKVGPPAEITPPNPDASLGSVERAKAVLFEKGEVRDGMYLIDGLRVSLGMFLQTANDVIARQNATVPRDQQKPLIGTNHHRWGQ